MAAGTRATTGRPRYEPRSTLMTSQRPREDWGKLRGDGPSATAILDRFLHHAEILALTGRSYRLKDRAGKDAGNSKECTAAGALGSGPGGPAPPAPA